MNIHIEMLDACLCVLMLLHEEEASSLIYKIAKWNLIKSDSGQLTIRSEVRVGVTNCVANEKKRKSKSRKQVPVWFAVAIRYTV